MYLKKISLINFKNYKQADVVFSAHVNCFTGNNGEGKTNLLDAIHYLSYCKSFFNPIDGQNILHDAPFFMIQGGFMVNNAEEEIACGLKRNQKKQFKRNKKEYERLADHIGLLPVVMISPADNALIYEGSEYRRKFIDSVIAQLDKNYLDDIISYNRILTQRNALLKQFAIHNYFDGQSLEIWDMQLIATGNRIYKKRTEFIQEFIALFNEHYKFIANDTEIVEISYQSQLHRKSFEELLAEAIKKDRALEYSTVGIHKDDLEFLLKGFAIKKTGSQGQQKSLLIALKLAQYDIIKRSKNFNPILLLDDIYAKLDDNRTRKLMELVSSKRFGQLFITDTNAARVRSVFERIDTELKLFEVKAGNVVEIQFKKLIA